MLPNFALLADIDLFLLFVVGGLLVLALLSLVFLYFVLKFAALWVQAWLCDADVALLSLIGMSFRRVNPTMIVNAKIMGRQAGLSIDRADGMSTARLEAHFLAGGDVMNVLRAIIAAQRAGITLDFDRAAAIDLAGRDILDAVQTSVSPKVIDCPDPVHSGRVTLSAVAKDGVELRVRVRVTVRTNLEQLIGGATEETIIARVAQGIITSIGSANLYSDVLEFPSQISKSVLDRGLDANTAFTIVSIDIADVEVGENIGARLQTDQAGAEIRMARARAEARRAAALARQQEMKAEVAASLGKLMEAEAGVPAALSFALRAGWFQRTPSRPNRVSLPIDSSRLTNRAVQETAN